MLALVPWRDKAQSAKDRGFPGSMGSRPFQLIRPWFACKARSTPDPKMPQSKAMYNPRLSGTLIGCLRFCRGVVRPKVQNRSFPGSMGSRPFQLIRPWFVCKARSTPIPKMTQSVAIFKPSAFRHFDRMFAVVSWRGKA